jgi:hypothetical protein
MRIYHLQVQHFRGIEHLDWKVRGNLVCLVGPGDSTKSTVLDAIELALLPRWNQSFDDTDFYATDTSKPISITVTVGDLPKKFMDEEEFGLELRGWSETDGLHDEPLEGDTPVLSIRLIVDDSLEPKWTVINDRRPDGRAISYKDRDRLSVARLGASFDWHLTWRRGSLLSRITDVGADKAEGIALILADAARAAHDGFEPGKLTALADAAKKAQKLAQEIGVSASKQYQPHLDFQSVNVSLGGVSLHDGAIPLRKVGLGSRRLLSVALQREVAKSGGFTLIDEVESGLEPHRVGRLVHLLCKDLTSTDGEAARIGGSIMTTHSPAALVEVPAANISIVRSKDGKTDIFDVEPGMQDMVRKFPEAMLGSRILVCEGKTELGFVRGLDEYWSSRKNLHCFAHQGVIPVTDLTGGGTNSPSHAVKFSCLGYAVAFLVDSDVPLKPTVAEMEAKGIRVLQWADGLSIEERIFADLPWSGVIEVVDAAMQEKGRDQILHGLAAELGVPVPDLAADPRQWPDRASGDEAKLRVALGKAAKKGSGWFKRIDYGEALAQPVTRWLDSIPSSNLAKTINELRTWVDQNG